MMIECNLPMTRSRCANSDISGNDNWRPEIKLTTHERKLVARVRARRTKANKRIVALIARGLRLAINDPRVNEEVERACRTWETLAANPEPRTPLQHLLAERSNLLVAERRVLQFAARRQVEDDDGSFYC